MASRYTQQYFFQHTLMNVSFRNLNEVFHRNAENIPGYIRHYASVVFVNATFRNEPTKIMDELKLEGHHTDYIQSYMSFVDMQRTGYNLVTKGKFFGYQIHYILLVIDKFFEYDEIHYILYFLFINTTIKTTPYLILFISP